MILAIWITVSWCGGWGVGGMQCAGDEGGMGPLSFFYLPIISVFCHDHQVSSLSHLCDWNAKQKQFRERKIYWLQVYSGGVGGHGMICMEPERSIKQLRPTPSDLIPLTRSHPKWSSTSQIRATLWGKCSKTWAYRVISHLNHNNHMSPGESEIILLF